MRMAVFGSLAAALVLVCGGSVGAEEKAVDLPRVSQVGDVPPEGHRVVIRVTAGGHIRVPGVEGSVSLARLASYLKTKTGDPKSREADGTNKLNAVLE